MGRDRRRRTNKAPNDTKQSSKVDIKQRKNNKNRRTSERMQLDECSPIDQIFKCSDNVEKHKPGKKSLLAEQNSNRGRAEA